MRHRILLLLLIGLLIAILIILARNGVGTVGPLSTGEFGSLAARALTLTLPHQGGGNEKTPPPQGGREREKA